MAEAEDVLIEAAEWASSAIRALWRRPAVEADAPACQADASLRRLDLWLTACFGRSWTLAPGDPDPRPSWLARFRSHLPPWARSPRAVAATDGERIFLPRPLLCAGQSGATSDALLVASLVLGARLHAGDSARTEAPPAERDLAWNAGGALAEGALARALPGLAPRMAALRRAELAQRPQLEQLLPAERAVEVELRALLATPPEETGDAPSLARRVRAAGARAARAGGEYRGAAPVLHWGIAVAAEPSAGRPGRSALSPAPSPRRARLRRRPVRRPPGPEEESDARRRGMFLLAPTDAHLALADPAGRVRPDDRGEEDADALAEELARLAAAPRVPSDAPVREVLEGDTPLRPPPGTPGPAPGANAWVYPEWDFARAAYRAAGCVLRERVAPASDAGWATQVRGRRAALLQRLRRHFEALRPQLRLVPRQLDGDHVDVDGWVEEFAERRAGGAPAGRLYAREQRRRRDVAVALLVDASGSTDAWVAGTQRVIDVAREATLCFSEALSSLGDRHAIYAFSGRGPGDVRVWAAKRFEEPLADAVRARIGGIQPGAYTRLGAPLRHATLRLARERSRAKLLLVLSDGKPNDEDRYEGTYGVEDVRQAVAEARLQGVRVFCVTIDRAGPAYLARMFGPAGYIVMRNVAQLPERLPELYRHLTAGA